METNCPNGCGSYTNLSKHWCQNSSCDYPDITNHQIDVIKGLIMGDASINLQSQDWSGRLDLSVVSKDFAKEAASELGFLTNSITIKKKDGISKNNQHRVVTYSHPIFRKIYNNWYTDKGKKFPEDLELNHTMLRFWYLGDGSLKFTNADTPYVTISVCNEKSRSDYLVNLFSSLGYKATCSSKELRVSTKDTPKLLSNISSVDDLSYKWELKKSKYDEMKRPYYKGTSEPL